MSYVEPEIYPKDKSGLMMVIAIIISVLLLFIILTPRVNAFEGDRLKQDPERVKREPVVMVDRHVLTLEDCAKDPSVLVSAARKTVTLDDVKAVQVATTREIVYVVEPKVDTGVVVTATIESDTEAPVNYPIN